MNRRAAVLAISPNALLTVPVVIVTSTTVLWLQLR
jgi:hypothetical protein